MGGGGPHRQFPGYRLMGFSLCFNFPGCFLPFPASPGPSSARRHPAGGPQSHQLSRNWEFPDVPCPGFAEAGVGWGGGVQQGAIAQVRPRFLPQTAGLTWARGPPEKARQLAHRAVLASLPLQSPGSKTRRLCWPARRCVVASLRFPLFFVDAPRRRAWAPPPPSSLGRIPRAGG